MKVLGFFGCSLFALALTCGQSFAAAELSGEKPMGIVGGNQAAAAAGAAVADPAAKPEIDDMAEIRKAAEAGDAEAEYKIGEDLVFKTMGSDRTEAFAWLEKAARQGHVLAKARLITVNFLEYEKRSPWFDEIDDVIAKLNEMAPGNLTAKCSLAEMAENGIGMSKDVNKALALYNEAANAGHAWAQTNLGYIYKDGVNVPVDEAKGVMWIKKASEQMFHPAVGTLAGMYMTGKGVEKNRAKAVGLMTMMAEQGNPGGYYGLWKAYKRGHGVAKDTVKAREYLEKAVAGGHEVAIKDLEKLKKEGK